MKRCSWVNVSDKKYLFYHDKEWGIPVYDDRLLFEMLILESFQAGLSWQTILQKRDNFKKAFDNFDVQKVSLYETKKIEELIRNEKIIRHRQKIESTVLNAQIFIRIQKEWGSFSNYVWHWTGGDILKGDGTQVRNKLSDKISTDLKKRGMKYVGSITIYSYLQAVGIINDHQLCCFLRQE